MHEMNTQLTFFLVFFSTNSSTKHGGKSAKLEERKSSPTKELDEKMTCYPSKRSKTVS